MEDMGSTAKNTKFDGNDIYAGVPQLLEELSELVNDRDTADVVFLVGADQVALYAHKLFLWTRCNSFRKCGQSFLTNQPGQSSCMTLTYPQFDPDVFSDVLIYIYTGKIHIKNLQVFSVLSIARELELTELQRQCEHIIQQNLCTENACAFLAAAMQVEKDLSGSSSADLEMSVACSQYIEEHAMACTKTEGWLELPKHALVRVISSENFALEEEDVWRAVISWAKYHAGVPLDKLPASWNEHEKSLICQALAGVIDHVKLLLIDSTVFAEEVEPTGAVPVELSLERYRFAAVPDKFSQSEDKRLRPRVCLQFFPGSTILVKEKLQCQRLLNQWYGNQKQAWRLLFRASRDGYSGEKFHKHCDGHAPTFTIILGSSGNVCGGFSDVPWTSNTPSRGRYISSNRAFLFTLCNNQGVAPTKFNVTKNHFATLHHPSYGPIFGAGADLCVGTLCNTGMECYSNMPHSYDGVGASCSILMGDYSFNILDYEVFTLKTV